VEIDGKIGPLCRLKIRNKKKIYHICGDTESFVRLSNIKVHQKSRVTHKKESNYQHAVQEQAPTKQVKKDKVRKKVNYERSNIEEDPTTKELKRQQAVREQVREEKAQIGKNKKAADTNASFSSDFKQFFILKDRYYKSLNNNIKDPVYSNLLITHLNKRKIEISERLGKVKHAHTRRKRELKKQLDDLETELRNAHVKKDNWIIEQRSIQKRNIQERLDARNNLLGNIRSICKKRVSIHKSKVSYYKQEDQWNQIVVSIDKLIPTDIFHNDESTHATYLKLRKYITLPFNEKYHSFVDSKADFLEAFTNNIEDPVYSNRLITHLNKRKIEISERLGKVKHTHTRRIREFKKQLDDLETELRDAHVKKDNWISEQKSIQKERLDASDKLSASIWSMMKARDHISFQGYKKNVYLWNEAIRVLQELTDIIAQMTQLGEISSDNPVAVTLGTLQKNGTLL
jgi:hypothetical protein